MLKLQQRLGRGRSVIGLHIGASSVNIAQVVQYKGKITLIKSVIQDIALKKGKDPDPEISSAIQAGLAQFSTQRADIICTFHDPQLFVKKIITPPMPLRELADAVHLAVKNDFPFSLDEALLDFHLARKHVHEGKEQFSVLLSACPREVVERIHSLCLFDKQDAVSGKTQRGSTDRTIAQLSRPRVASITPGAIALENLVRRFKLRQNETVAIIALRSRATELMVYHDSHFEFFRNLSVTGEDITKSMAGDFFSDTGKTQLTLSEAEEIKTEYGIPKTGDELPAQAKITSSQILTLIGPVIEQMVTEINRSFDYYRQELKGCKVDRLFLVGRGARLKGLCVYLKNELGLEVALGDPFEGVAVLDASMVGSIDEAQKKVFAIGAALGDKKDINFLSQMSPKKSGFEMTKFIACLVAVSVIFLNIFAFVHLNGQVMRYKAQVNAKKLKLASQIRELREFEAIMKLKDQRPSWGNNLKSFSHIPKNVHLVELSFSGDKFYIRGVVQENDKNPHDVLSVLLNDLRENIAKDAVLKLTKRIKGTDNQYSFEVVATVIPKKQ